MTNSLLLGSAILGAVILVMLVLYNEYQERRYFPRQQQPALKPDDHTSEHNTLLPLNMANAATIAAVERPPTPLCVQLDEGLDAIAYIHLRPATAIEGSEALAAMPASLLALDKPFTIEGCCHNSSQWRPISAGMYYSAFRAGVQLANQAGPISEQALHEFQLRVQEFASNPVIASVGIDWPDWAKALERGRYLDVFADTHDVHLHFTIHSAEHDSGWSVAYLLQQAQQHGFVISAVPGQLVLPARVKSEDENGERTITLLTLKFDPEAAQAPNLHQAAISQFQINMALSAVPVSADPILHIYSITSTMSKQMGGSVVDNVHHTRVGDDTLGDLMHRLGQLYKQMDEAGFPAGSALLQRLLS